MRKLIQIHTKDNVAVALTDIFCGEDVLVGEMALTPVSDIPQGHKIALRDMKPGEPVVKYGVPIGHATCPIRAGDWVHTHNMATNLTGESDYRYCPRTAPAWEPKKLADHCRSKADLSFLGYQRPDGRAGIRNEIWIIPTVGCVNGIARKLAGENQDLVTGTIDGLYAFTHPFGCSQTGADHVQTGKLLAALINHPNAGAVLVVGLGCENLTMKQLQDQLGDYDPRRVRFLICQQETDELTAGRERLMECASWAGGFSRRRLPVNQLVVGLKCGGSDGLSGITANPVVGHLSDLLCAMGGTAVLTEVPEMFGAEQMLLSRCQTPDIYEKAVEMLLGFKQYFISHGEVVYENPSPGNKQGGITTLEDKSCGCVQKGGSAPVTDVLRYADQVTRRGLNLLSGPGNDLVSATALTAAGCHMILFTTGRGTPFGAPAPTLKIATNSGLYLRKAMWLDFNAGGVADSKQTIRDAGELLFEKVLAVASGEQTCSERQGYRDISIFKDGVVL